ncbi:MAG: small multi-drug export protein [Candidatus Verstraetearchaeota archaeon]|nr:small multi-drug export protein [Candidatus Verstraetearchaeota archaeon]
MTGEAEEMDVPQILYVLLIAISPILECRGSIPYGIFAGIDVPTVFLVSLLGNILPVPFLLIFLSKIEGWIMRRKDENPVKRAFVRYILSLSKKSKSQVDRYGFWGLVIFVAVPILGTGAWTSSVIAYLFGMEIKRAFAAIVLGVLGVAVIVTVAVLGFGLIL